VRNLASVSSAPIAKLGDRQYYDLVGTLEVMGKLHRESAVDGFELQLEPEWDGENPPLTDAHLADWTKTPKHSFKEILDLVRSEGLPILSVHASRDIGSYLCSDRERDLGKGKRLIYDSLRLTSGLGADICVFHLWDTRKEELDITRLRRTLLDIAPHFPEVKASVENVPTHLKGSTPFDLLQIFDYLTLDLRWAAFYKELDAFESIVDRIVNVHLRGRLEEEKWILDQSSFDFYEALDKIKNVWRYSGLFTIEPEGNMDSSCFRRFVRSVNSLKARMDE